MKLSEVLQLEAAVAPSTASEKGLVALKNTATNTKIWLFDENLFLRDLAEKMSVAQKVVDAVSELLQGHEYFYGFIVLEPANARPACYGAREVVGSAAIKGYGPMMYDLALHVSTSGIFADRNDVSPQAYKVWEYFKNNRPDVKHKKIDDVDNPKTPAKFDDGWVHKNEDDEIDSESPLNYIYRKSYDNSSAQEQMLRQGRQLLKKINSIAPQKGELQLKELEEFLSESSEKFFQSKYRRSP